LNTYRGLPDNQDVIFYYNLLKILARKQPHNNYAVLLTKMLSFVVSFDAYVHAARLVIAKHPQLEYLRDEN